VPTRASSGVRRARNDPFSAAARLVAAIRIISTTGIRVAARRFHRRLERRQISLSSKRTEQRLPLERVDHPLAATMMPA
jgi:hypothetical protein